MRYVAPVAECVELENVNVILASVVETTEETLPVGGDDGEWA